MSSVLQDVRLVGRDFILIPNVTYGGWLRAFEGNLLGAADELARTGDPVRGPLAEPQDEFSYPSPTQPPGGPLAAVKPLGPKFREGRLLRIWHR
jgi:hypothetical protein